MAYIKDGIRSVLVQFIVLGAALTGGIINARWLGPEGVGIYVLLGMIPNLCFRFGNLGFGSSLSFFLARKKISLKDAVRLMWSLGMLLSLTSGVILILAWDLPFLPWHDVPVNLLYTSILLVPLAFMQNFAQRVLAGRLKISDINNSELLATFAYIGLLTLLVIFLDYGVAGALASLLASKIIVVSYLILRIHKEPGEKVLDEPALNRKGQTTEMWCYGRWNYLIMLNRYLLDWFPVFVLKYVSGNGSIGLYSVARTIGDKLQTVPNAFSSVIFPYTASSSLEQAKYRTNATTRIFMFIMTVSAFILGILAEPLMLFLYGPGFEGAAQVLHLLLPVIVFFPLYKFQNTHLTAIGKSKQASASSLVIQPLSIILSLTLIPSYGLPGAPVAISATYTAISVWTLLLYRRSTGSGLREMILINKQDIQTLKSSIHTLLKRQ